MKIAVIHIVALLVFLGASGCGDDFGTCMFDHIWTVTYLVSNASTSGISVELAGPVYGGLGVYRVDVNPGDVAEVLKYSRFLAPPPDAGREFWCVSVYRASDHVLVHQLCPVENEQWTRRDLARFEAEFTLLVAERDMEAVPDHCPRLEGVVSDASSGEAIDQALALLHFNDFHYGHTFVRSSDGGDYSLSAPCEMPDGELLFDAEGYDSRTFPFPEALIDLGDNIYRLDVELTSED